jgi:sigma-B regulation protein RsbU (phosphoserine phosphatase)
MRSFTSWPRPVQLSLAVVFAAITTAYSILWMYYIRRLPPGGIGIGYYAYSEAEAALRVSRAHPNSAARAAGVRRGDRITAVNGKPLTSFQPYYDHVLRSRGGDVVRLTIERPGTPSPMELAAKVSPPLQVLAPQSRTQSTALELIGFYPLLFLVVGMTVLFLRPGDRNAWLLALLFAGFIATPEPGGLEAEGAIHSSIRGFLLAFHYGFGVMTVAFLLYFFSVFPLRSPLDRRAPWLKWVYLCAGGAAALTAAVLVWVTGSRSSFLDLAYWLNRRAGFWAAGTTYSLSGIGLALVSLVWNGWKAPAAEARKIRVIVWGVVAGMAPVLLLILARIARGVRGGNPFFGLPFWVWVSSVAALFLIPLSFAYAVVKHRVLGITLLLKRSARYILVRRGFEIFTVLETVAVVWLFVALISRVFKQWQQFAIPAGIGAGVWFGLLLAWVTTKVQRNVSRRIDRAFFRGAYDARKILEELTEKTRTIQTREELASLLERHLREALHPTSLIIYLEAAGGGLEVASGHAPPEARQVDVTAPALADLARHGRPGEVDPNSQNLGALAALKPECLVPVLARDGRLLGLIVLGQRLSEEAYSREDMRLLASAAGQAGLAMESIRLAERMAERIQLESRAAYEMELAKNVQARLFPQRAPMLRTLDYTGRCIQARAVGGDYYDFLDFGSGRAGLVLADVSGKGMAAALLMATLQANLRSQYAVALEGLPRLLQSANRSLYESTSSEHYCTLFFGDYQDSSRLLRYANCGHNPPVLLRASGHVERLDPTATVLGAFPSWQCSVSEVDLAPGDLLAVYTDGVTEARDERGVEFGEGRLIDVLMANRDVPVSALLANLIRSVQEFSGREQADDLTLVVARAV